MTTWQAAVREKWYFKIQAMYQVCVGDANTLTMYCIQYSFTPDETTGKTTNLFHRKFDLPGSCQKQMVYHHVVHDQVQWHGCQNQVFSLLTEITTSQSSHISTWSYHGLLLSSFHKDIKLIVPCILLSLFSIMHKLQNKQNYVIRMVDVILCMVRILMRIWESTFTQILARTVLIKKMRSLGRIHRSSINLCKIQNGFWQNSTLDCYLCHYFVISSSIIQIYTAMRSSG